MNLQNFSTGGESTEQDHKTGFHTASGQKAMRIFRIAEFQIFGLKRTGLCVFLAAMSYEIKRLLFFWHAVA